jgi:uncharacterized RDD family membrane protein YckC
MAIATNEEQPEAGAGALPVKPAGRFWRLFAAIIDGIVVTALLLPVYWYFHVWQDIWTGIRPPFGIIVICQAAWLVAFAVINFWLLEQRGQTVGKWCMGIAIVGLDGGNKGAVHLLVYRFVPALLFPEVPFVGSLFTLVDTLAIFGRERRCIHDRIAGTKVIETESPSEEG